ncbi:hypothetical protein F5050DRAFT_1709907 [Lentinula boryana]|uniref:Uncharacterized protein n=1 Tax=Lentinula boryana TaxID=40481 RepID=A0ABQ8QKZ0_9AGAR|nr:hypothetical protein F5050DRAFT_1709907 [Lentinula boryana]
MTEIEAVLYHSNEGLACGRRGKSGTETYGRKRVARIRSQLEEFDVERSVDRIIDSCQGREGSSMILRKPGAQVNSNIHTSAPVRCHLSPLVELLVDFYSKLSLVTLSVALDDPMFFQITPPRLLALLHLGASLLWVSASPLRNLNADVARYKRRADSSVVDQPILTVPSVTKRSVQVDVDLVIDGYGSSEHWFVDVGPTLFQAGTRDPSTMNKFKSKLTTSHYDWDKVKNQLSSSHKIIPLGKATFKNSADQKAAFTKVGKIKMRAAAAVKGGNCLDYIMDVLDLLEQEGHITAAVVDAYRQEYYDNYTRVSKAVWGVDLQP